MYYFLILALGAIFAVVAMSRFHWSVAQMAVLIVVLLLPGRILGFFWRDLLAGLRLLNERRFEESVLHTNRFLDQLARRPWIRHLIWLGSGTYSRNPKAMALNNLGTAEMFLGNAEAAKVFLTEATELDRESPLSYFNLAQLHALLGEPAEAQQFLARAKQLGYTRGLSDKLIRQSQLRFAGTDGSGSRPAIPARKTGQSPVFTPDTALLEMEGFAPNGFRYGIEILNDESTSMEFVVSALQDLVGLGRSEAMRLMLEIHRRGGVLIPLQSMEDSRRVAEAVTARARESSYPLICRAVQAD